MVDLPPQVAWWIMVGGRQPATRHWGCDSILESLLGLAIAVGEQVVEDNIDVVQSKIIAMQDDNQNSSYYEDYEAELAEHYDNGPGEHHSRSSHEDSDYVSEGDYEYEGDYGNGARAWDRRARKRRQRQRQKAKEARDNWHLIPDDPYPKHRRRLQYVPLRTRRYRNPRVAYTRGGVWR